MKKATKYSPEVHERAVRMIHEHRGDYPSLWATVESIAPKIGCTPSTLLDWFKRSEVDNGKRPGVTTDERERMKALEREVKVRWFEYATMSPCGGKHFLQPCNARELRAHNVATLTQSLFMQLALTVNNKESVTISSMSSWHQRSTRTDTCDNSIAQSTAFPH